MRLARLLSIILLACPLFILPDTASSGWLDDGQQLINSLKTPQAKPGLQTTEIATGLKEALRVGSERVVARLGAENGFNADREVHIPLPPELEKVHSALTVIGMGGMTEDLELQLNRAAEAATPKAKQLFWQAISELTIDDVMGIYNGPEDAATRYFKGKMSSPLSEEMRPVVDESLAKVGAIQSYNAALGEYAKLPFVPDIHADLTAWVVEKGLDGIFYYLAKEEAAIRANPAKRTTALLQKVFGQGN